MKIVARQFGLLIAISSYAKKLLEDLVLAIRY